MTTLEFIRSYILIKKNDITQQIRVLDNQDSRMMALYDMSNRVSAVNRRA